MRLPAARLCLLTALAALSLRGAPVFYCPAPLFDLGELEAGAAATHVFTLENRGDQELTLDDPRASCGACATLRLDPARIAPGKAGRIEVKLDLSGMRGLLRVPLQMRTNDPARPTAELVLHGMVRSDILITPDSLSFPRIPYDGVVSGRVEIACVSTNRMVVKEAVSNHPAVTAQVTPIEPGQRYEVVVQVAGAALAAAADSAPPATLDTRLSLRLEHPTQSTLPLPVSGSLHDRLMVAPKVIPLAAGPGMGVVRQLTIQHEDEPDFRVTRVVWPDGASVRFEWTLVGRGRGRLSLPDAYATPEMNGRDVVIHTTLRDRPEIRVPLRVLAAGASPTSPSP